MTHAENALGGDWSDLVVVCAATSWDGVPFPEKHIARQLARYTPVLYVDPPMSWLTPRRNPELADSLRGPRLRLVAPDLARLTPVVNPGPSRPLLRSAARVLTRRAVRSAVRELGARPRAVVAACMYDLLDVVDTDQRVFYGTDDFVAGAKLVGVSARWLRAAESRQIRKADKVVAISDVLAELWRDRDTPTYTIPNGVEAEMYADSDAAPLPDDVDLPRPIAGFIGHLSHRIDLALLEAVADSGVSLLLVGPKQHSFAFDQVEALLARPNVQWVGAKPFEALPGYLRCMDVGLTPYRNDDFNRASYPLKTLEYLAGGRPVVSTDLPVNDLLDRELLTTAGTPAEFAEAVQRVLKDPGGPDEAARRREFAGRHSWTARGRLFAQLLGIDVPDAAADPTPEASGKRAGRERAGR
jgi:teichuronic acid biosynthesis glycosyltransferase TuaH